MTAIKLISKPKRTETTEVQRSVIITLYGEGYPFAKIAEKTGVPKSTCYSIVKRDKDNRKPGSLVPYTKNASRKGQPEKLSLRERQFLVWIARRCRRTVLNQLIKFLPTSITKKTTRKYLAKAGIHRHRAKRKPFLKKQHMVNRLK
jgi:transposase